MARKTTKTAGKARKAPKTAATTAKTPRTPKPATPRAERPRDPRLPAAGTILTRPYKGKDYRVTVLDAGFRWDGREFRSLSKLASAITGQASINGFLWMNLTGPRATAAARAPKLVKAKGGAKRAKAEAAPVAEAAPEAAPAAETATV